MIKRIVLENFMSHAHTVIEPAEGLTMLVGPNNCGKSAIVEALRAVCENTQTDFMVRHGAKEAIVTIETDDGHVIAWHRRKRSASYVIDGVRNDRPGADCLEKVHRLLKLPRVKAPESNEEFDVHFGAQKSPIFLLNESGTRAATFFASSSDAERLLQMQRNHRNKVADDKKEEQRRADTLADLDAKLATLAPLDEIAPRLSNVETGYAELKNGIGEAQRLEILHARLKRAGQQVLRHNAQKEAAAALAPPPSLGDEQAIDRLIRRYKNSLRRRDMATDQSTVLADVEAPPMLADAPALEMLCRRRRAVERRIARWSATGNELSDLRDPPVSKETFLLVQRIASLKRSAIARDFAAARLARLQRIAEPPPMHDIKPTVDLLTRFRTAASAVERRRTAAESATEQLARAERSIQSWAAQNPTCPVCNGTVDPARLLNLTGENAPENAGAHAHA